MSCSAFALCAGTAYAADVAAAEIADAAEQDSTGLTEIVVTATKRETNLQDTPISIAVMGNEEIKKRHVQSLIDLADGAIPSLRVATFEARQSALTIGLRGIVPGDANQPAREQGVGVYLDGVYLGRQHGLNTGLLDVERIEVLKGPQGTLFGRNTEGGAVSIVSKAPTGEFGGRVSAGIGNYGAYNGALHLDLPRIAGVAFKIDGGVQHQGPTVKNPLPGQAGWNQFHRYGGRVAARMEPLDGLTADLSFDINRDENTPFYSQLINYNPNDLPVATLAEITANGNKLPAGKIAPLPEAVKVHADRQSVADIGVPQQPSIGKTKGFTANLKYRVNGDLELRSITAWRTVSDSQWDNSGGANRTPVFLPNGNFSRYSLASLEQRQFSQELQGVGSIGNLDYVLGAYYFNEKASDWARTPNTNRWNATGTAYTINDQAAYLSVPIARASDAWAKSYAAYANLTYNLGTLHLTAGGRYSHDEKNGKLHTINGAPASYTFDITNDRFDPLVVLAWDAARDINVYAKYATGYRAGGASSRSLTYRSFDPETVRSYDNRAQDAGTYVITTGATFDNDAGDKVVVRIGAGDLIYNAQHSAFSGSDDHFAYGNGQVNGSVDWFGDEGWFSLGNGLDLDPVQEVQVLSWARNGTGEDAGAGSFSLQYNGETYQLSLSGLSDDTDALEAALGEGSSVVVSTVGSDDITVTITGAYDGSDVAITSVTDISGTNWLATFTGNSISDGEGPTDGLGNDAIEIFTFVGDDIGDVVIGGFRPNGLAFDNNEEDRLDFSAFADITGADDLKISIEQNVDGYFDDIIIDFVNEEYGSIRLVGAGEYFTDANVNGIANSITFA